jgi:hypothetical protein
VKARVQLKLGEARADARGLEGSLWKKTSNRMVGNDARFIEAVEEGRAAARRGDLLEHEEVVDRIEQMFRS